MQGIRRTQSLLAVIAAVAVVAGACSSGAPKKRVSIQRRITTTSSTLAPTTITTLTPTTHVTAAPLPGLGVGARGQAVADLETKLAAMHYDPGKVDGYYDSTTAFAVMAFQKVNGMARTGRATDDVVAAVAAGLRAAGHAPGGRRQPGRGRHRAPGAVPLPERRPAADPPGVHRVGQAVLREGECALRRHPGRLVPGRLPHPRAGTRARSAILYNPLFFNGGIAIHGAPSVPAYPASHGCVRIPMADSLWFFNTVPKGTPVYVLGGQDAPVPFNEAAPDGTPPAVTSPPTTSTTPPTTAAPHPTSTIVPPQHHDDDHHHRRPQEVRATAGGRRRGRLRGRPPA